MTFPNIAKMHIDDGMKSTDWKHRLAKERAVWKERLAKARGIAGFTSGNHFADVAGYPRATYHHWENTDNTAGPPPEAIKEICDELKISVDSLLCPARVGQESEPSQNGRQRQETLTDDQLYIAQVFADSGLSRKEAFDRLRIPKGNVVVVDTTPPPSTAAGFGKGEDALGIKPSFQVNVSDPPPPKKRPGETG